MYVHSAVTHWGLELTWVSDCMLPGLKVWSRQNQSLWKDLLLSSEAYIWVNPSCHIQLDAWGVGVYDSWTIQTMLYNVIKRGHFLSNCIVMGYNTRWIQGIVVDVCMRSVTRKKSTDETLDWGPVWVWHLCWLEEEWHHDMVFIVFPFCAIWHFECVCLSEVVHWTLVYCVCVVQLWQ